MAPLTRMRAANPGHAPTELHAEYYAQRASAGLIIGECTEISLDAYGWADTPGLWSPEQVRGWRGVTDAVHKKGGLMYAQLWHTGAMSHPDFFDGALPMSASNVNPEQESVTPSGRKPTVAPRPMSKEEIRQTVADFGIAAKNAMEAGFDGVQIQANYLYLIAQFLNSATNLRKDEYWRLHREPSPLSVRNHRGRSRTRGARTSGYKDWTNEHTEFNARLQATRRNQGRFSEDIGSLRRQC
jgi:N-ethylmaleimide reductase